MKMGVHQETLIASTAQASEVIWFKTAGAELAIGRVSTG